ncbi:HAD-like domain-containing protein [Amanita rubescens]|nr:HAD-like domain-containing protein [Amanita rubescens]
MQASRPKIEYVLFDMDGLMIDSEGMFTKVINEILRPYGKQMTWDIKAGCMGLPEEASAKHLLSFFPDIPLTLESCLAQKNEMLDKLWPTVSVLPGVRKLVHHLKAHNIPIAVATSSRRHKYELKITNLGNIFSQFEDKVVCSDDKQYNMRGKPNPDIFITAAREMLGRNVGHPEVECTTDNLQERARGLVFEDALPGVQAGKRADMSVIWVPDPNLLNIEYSGTEKPDQILKSLEDFVPEEWGLPPYQ